MILAECVFLVSGGSSGLGAATVQMALDAGARVVIADLAQPENWSTRALNPSLAFVATDVSDEASAARATATALERFGRLDVLVNTAGIALGERIHSKHGPHLLQSFSKVIQVNLLGTFNMMRLAVPAFLAGDGDKSGSQGVIINTASVAAFDGQMGQAAYAASKGGIVAMTLPVARDLARQRIRVMTIAPGIFETPMLQSLPQDVQTALGKSVPNPARLGNPAEYAALVRHIVENEYLNGEVIRLDGALRMAAK